MTRVNWEIRVDGGSIRQLAEWLGTEDELRGGVRLAPAPPLRGELGAVTDIIAVALGPGAVVAVLVESICGWLRTRSSDLTVRVRRPDGTEVEMTATRIRGLTAAELAPAVDKISDALTRAAAIDA
ncbi:effector-associated constant component EACC1 [Micromonosporaceae bacterium Da 78-11]